MPIINFLKQMVTDKASDMFISVGMPPSMRINGEVKELTQTPFSQADTLRIIHGLMDENQKEEFHAAKECNFAVDIAEVGRFRVSAFVQRNFPGCVIRYINSAIPTIDELKLPPILKALALSKKGLIIIVGATGNGKTTTLAAMMGYRNHVTKGHILTIEDPIEYIHTHDKCIITQREVGMDTASFEVAFKNAMRQSPDVVQIGEIRDAQVMRHALNFAETGHACLATLHAMNTLQALERISNFFTEEMRNPLWMDLSQNLHAIVAQRLIHRSDGKERVVAVEVLVNTPLIAECIRKGQIYNVKDIMMRKNSYGMRTFDQALYNLYAAGEITEETAIAHADSANNVRLMIKLNTTVPEEDPAISKLQLEKRKDH